MGQVKRPFKLYFFYKSMASVTAVQPIELSSRQRQLLQLNVSGCHHTLIFQRISLPWATVAGLPFHFPINCMDFHGNGCHDAP